MFEHYWDARPGVQKDAVCPFLDQNQRVQKLIEDTTSPLSGDIFDKVESISESSMVEGIAQTRVWVQQMQEMPPGAWK